MFKNRIALPKSATANELVEVKTLISHPMESGFRRDSVGKVRPRNIIKLFRCVYNGEPVIEAEFFPGVAANPYLSFYFKAIKSGQLRFVWIDQQGNETSELREITVN
jgi:sulfur-oxidizing protein SoxZ